MGNNYNNVREVVLDLFSSSFFNVLSIMCTLYYVLWKQNLKFKLRSNYIVLIIVEDTIQHIVFHHHHRNSNYDLESHILKPQTFESTIMAHFNWYSVQKYSNKKVLLFSRKLEMNMKLLCYYFNWSVGRIL